MLTQLWIVPLVATVAVWWIVAKCPEPTPEDDGGFECRPMFETTSRIGIAFALTIFIWLAYVTVALWVAQHG